MLYYKPDEGPRLKINVLLAVDLSLALGTFCSLCYLAHPLSL